MVVVVDAVDGENVVMVIVVVEEEELFFLF